MLLLSGTVSAPGQFQHSRSVTTSVTSLELKNSIEETVVMYHIFLMENSTVEWEGGGGFNSNIGNIDVGVPQGYCLGPLLLLIYINDLPTVVFASTVAMYADDTSLTLQSKDISQINDAINDNLKRLDLWM